MHTKLLIRLARVGDYCNYVNYDDLKQFLEIYEKFINIGEFNYKECKNDIAIQSQIIVSNLCDGGYINEAREYLNLLFSYDMINYLIDDLNTEKNKEDVENFNKIKQARKLIWFENIKFN